MLPQSKSVDLANLQLVFFYQRVLKFHDFIALRANQMVVVALVIQFFKSFLTL